MLDLSKLGLTAEQIANRRTGIGGSDATIIMGGDADAIFKLWQVKTGRTVSDDLSDVLPVMMGHATEAFNLAWFNKITGRPVSRMGEQVRYPKWETARCTLDGFTVSNDGRPAVLQAKHVNQFSKKDAVFEKYYNQVQHEMLCNEVDRAVLSVLIGTMDYIYIDIVLDDLQVLDLLEAEQKFWRYVTDDIAPPTTATAIPAPKLEISTMREVDMSRNNEWVDKATDWALNRIAAEKFAKATEELKGFVEPDVKLAYGAGVRIVRKGNGLHVSAEPTEAEKAAAEEKAAKKEKSNGRKRAA